MITGPRTSSRSKPAAAACARRSSYSWRKAELLGRRIEDIAALDLVATTPVAWQRFLADGRQDGQFRLLHRDDHEIPLRFQARTHHPIAGFHTSRLWPEVTRE
jgi:hypothetical protein